MWPSVLQYRLPNIRHSGHVTLQVEPLAENYLEQLLYIDRMRRGREDKRAPHSLRKRSGMSNHIALQIHAETREQVEFGADQERNECVVEPSSLPVPFLNASQRYSSRKVEHEKNRCSICAHERNHLIELVLPAAKVENSKRHGAVAHRNDFFHEVDAERLNVVFLEFVFDILDHKRGLSDVRISQHPNL